MNTVTVRMHGFMRQKYGKEVTLAGNSIKKIMAGLKHRFGQSIVEDIAANNWHLVKGKNLRNPNEMSEEQLGLNLNTDVLHLIPATVKAAQRFAQIIVGIILIVASYYGGGPQCFAAGVSLIVGGVLNLLFAPKALSGTMDTASGSYIYNGAVNITTQGGAKPLLFGQVDRCSSVVISSDFSTDRLVYNTPIDPGNTDPGIYVDPY